MCNKSILQNSDSPPTKRINKMVHFLRNWKERCTLSAICSPCFQHSHVFLRFYWWCLSNPSPSKFKGMFPFFLIYYSSHHYNLYYRFSEALSVLQNAQNTSFNSTYETMILLFLEVQKTSFLSIKFLK